VSNRRLLLADDSLTIQKVVNLTFSDEGFDVQTVGDGDTALEAIRAFIPDIVLADVNMPGADGYSICESLRSGDATKNVPVILLVGSFEPFDEERAGLVGANAFLTKPFQSIRQLIAQVNELLDAPIASNLNVEPEQPTPNRAIADQPDDIDSLYTQSFSSNAPIHTDDDLETSLSGFDDGGLDDEMIETSYLGSDKDHDTLDFEIASAPEEETDHPARDITDLSPAIDQYFTEPQPVATGYETRPLDPFSTHAEIPAFGHPQSLEEPETEPIRTADTYAETFPNVEHSSPDQTEPDGSGNLAEDQLVPEAPTQFIQTEGTEEPVGQMGVQTASFDPPVSSRVFDEIDLLDLPLIGGAETVELTTAERTEIMGSDKQVMSLSPELMEVIVQKVVERLSQKY
jgi:Response regulators consisting of a CheY-like receiver domain and a winged-helix DNA-binding domain